MAHSGHSSAVALRLPPALPEAAPADPAPRVLLVEDDPLQARGLLRLLDACGITCHSVPTTAAALGAVASQPPYDAIVSDLGVPDLSGAELARRLRRPVLIAYSGRSGRPPFFDAHVTKPHLDELLALLRARRLTVALLSTGEGQCLGHVIETGLLCRASSPAHALRILATAIDSGL